MKIQLVSKPFWLSYCIRKTCLELDQAIGRHASPLFLIDIDQVGAERLHIQMQTKQVYRANETPKIYMQISFAVISDLCVTPQLSRCMLIHN